MSDLLAWQGVVIFVLVLIASAVLLVVYLRHHRAVLQARAENARDDAYRRLAEQTTTEVAHVFVVCGASHAVLIQPALPA